jgi:lipoprotein-anchoring transpeptidase ErfK/SrfK
MVPSLLPLAATVVALASAPAPTLQPAFQIAHVHAATALRASPHGALVARVGARTEFGSSETLGVVRRRGDWLGVVSSARPNGRLAWVRSSSVSLSRTRYSLELDLSQRTLVPKQGDRVVRRMKVGVGRPGSPTPTGRFAVTDKLRGSPYGPYYGCCIIALSAHQPRLPAGWPGGDRIAIHGTNAPATIGAAASAGCAHARDADLRVLVRRIPLGTPVFIHP